MDQDDIQIRLNQWFRRKKNRSSARQVRELPFALGSDVGLIRSENQDCVGVLRAQLSSKRSFLVAVLCDGMGGMVDGTECSALAVSSFITGCIRNRLLPPEKRLISAVESANSQVFERYDRKGGTTLSAFLLDSEGNTVGINVGDSRIYSCSNGYLRQLSTDDTIAGQFAGDKRAGLNADLIQYVGIGREIEPHLIDLSHLDKDSEIILTSDGVHYLNEDVMGSVINNSSSPIESVTRLLELSKWCGGRDNASIILASELNSLLSPQEELPGTVEVWGVAGDLQFIGVEKEGGKGARQKAPVTVDDKSANPASGIRGVSDRKDEPRQVVPDKPPEKKRKKAAPKPNKKKSKKAAVKDAKKMADEKPQLDIF